MVLVFPAGNIANNFLAIGFFEISNYCLKSVTLEAKFPRHIRRPFFRLVGLS